MLSEKRCGVLGCTGSVGQRFILLLAKHPTFKIHALGASSRSEGKKYKDAVRWKQDAPMSAELGELVIQSCKPENFQGCDIVFSGLDADVAGDIETAFVARGHHVFSNAKNHRMDPKVPLIIPTVNINHLSIIAHQRSQNHPGYGFIVCNSNCAVVGVAVPIFALQEKFGPVSQASVVTMQAVSGAGYPGVSSMDIMDNVVPYIKGEEDKLENEAQKILGSIKQESSDSQICQHLDTLHISAACNRVAVLDGHVACVSLKFAKQPPPREEEVKDAMKQYLSSVQKLECPSAPANAITVFEEDDRPQPRLDRGLQGGYTVSVGRVRKDLSGVFDYKFVALSHNTIIGAAGSSILNAEAAVIKGII